MELDFRGLYCPIPVLRTREEVGKLAIGEILVVTADDPAAEEDITRWAKRVGQDVMDVKKNGDEVTIRIRRLK
jgi:tRNA 2-thiouridine synthesizing protein A